jgi:hypothetical protein
MSREIDRRIAATFFDWDNRWVNTECPSYSTTDMSAALDVLEKVKKGPRVYYSDGWGFDDTVHIRYVSDGNRWLVWWQATNYSEVLHSTIAETLPMAICLFALKTVEVP